jgi:hypothetical protein
MSGSYVVKAIPSRAERSGTAMQVSSSYASFLPHLVRPTSCYQNEGTSCPSAMPTRWFVSGMESLSPMFDRLARLAKVVQVA